MRSVGFYTGECSGKGPANEPFRAEADRNQHGKDADDRPWSAVIHVARENSCYAPKLFWYARYC